MMETVTRLKIAARKRLGRALPRCADACPSADFRTPQERINANQIEADEYDAAWRRALAFGAPLVAIALFAIVLFAADPIGRLAEWRWAVDHVEVAR